jgi:peptidoglycan hydrolase CwlO-like protein
MQIDPKVLSEKNYTGTRLIPVDSVKLKELQKELDSYQRQINPILDKLSKEYYPAVDPLYQRIAKLQEEIKPLKEKIAEINNKFQEDTDKIQKVEQKAMLVKNKMQPIILKSIEGQLGEFEIARHTVVKDGKVYVEVFDEIEEKVKQIRANKKK